MTKKTRAKNKAPGIDSAASREGFPTAVAWYRPDQWNQLLEVSSDRDNLEDRYEDWLATATRMVGELKGMGLKLELVEVDIDDLVRWCRARHKRIDGPARSEYVCEKLREKYETGR